MSASDSRLGDLLTDIEEGRLIVRPAFQRRLVWTNKDKEFFIDTVLKRYPFPEIFICTGESVAGKSARKRWLVDGQQRLTTLLAYYHGSEKDILCKTVPTFNSLSDEEQVVFLDTTVAVRDLGSVDDDRLKEIFTRINSTDYSLTSMERRNARFSGAFKQYCLTLSSQEFFKGVFPAGREKRMEDLAFCVILVTTIMAGYYQRDALNQEYLERYNDEFPKEGEIQRGLDIVFDIINQCEFSKVSPRSSAWKLTNLFSLLVELYDSTIVNGLVISATKLSERLTDFFAHVDNVTKTPDAEHHEPHVLAYWRASKTAANDKHQRVNRATILAKIIKQCAEAQKTPATKAPRKVKAKR